ncbi:tail protein [Arthrobacter phage Heisenberger]|uniref:Minor tail protein n=1 Tax=Arthrobacter phage Heisenberger TaxID=2024277 RepID=A0A222Z825_9CAUD|nr:tail protein [Arthrobacter phage Heisenberger]ASR80273.1 minor tail protein [Arthrobacter phage Heisenberger]
MERPPRPLFLGAKMVFNMFPAVDENFDLPTQVRQRLAQSSELSAAITTGIASNNAVTSAAVQAMNDAAVQAQLAWNKQAMTSGSLNSKVTPSTFPVTNLAVTDRPPIAAYGNVTVVPVASNAVVQEYRTNQAISTLWTRRGLTDGTSWSAWREIDAEAAFARIYKGLTPNDTNLNSLVEHGTVWGVSGSGITNKPPTAYNGTVEVFTIGSGVTQRYTTVGAEPEVYVRRGNTDGITWFDWVRTDFGAIKTSTAQTGSVRREFLRQNLLNRKGIIGTADRGAVAIRVDDYHADTNAKLIPIISERKVPYTQVTTSESVNGEVIPAGSFDIVQANAIKYGGEVWAHGKTHGEATTNAEIDAETIGALATLRAAMPRIPIDCFAPPGGSVTWGGYLPGTTISSWADTRAGQNLMANYALASGYLPDTYYRTLDGKLRDGQIHYSLDSYTLANAKARVDSARDWKCGVVLMFHAKNIGAPGYMSLEDFTLLIDYIVAQRDAGNLLVLTVSGLGVADRSTDYRDDLLTVHSGNPFSQSFTWPQYRAGIRGSTRELTAIVTASGGATVTSVIGESTLTHQIPSNGDWLIRHLATIPTDVTTLTVSINATTRDAHLYSV